MAQQEQRNDEHLGVTFYQGSKLNKAKTEEAKRPIYESVEMVRIKFPGDRSRVVEAPAHAMHYGGTPPQHWTYAERFADIYETFQSKGEQVIGTPLSEAPFMNEGQRETYRAAGIYSVEQLAEMSGAAARRMGMGAQGLKEEAQAYLEVANETADVLALKRELEELKAAVAAGGVAQKAPVAPTGEVTQSDVDAFAPYENEDIKNMIADAGGKIPRGNASRETLIKALKDAQEPAAA